MYKKEITEFIIYEQLSIIQEYPSLNGAIHLHLDTYTQILDVFNSTNEPVRSLIDKLSHTYPIDNEPFNEETNQISSGCTTEKVEMIITEQVMKIQNDQSLKKSISFHAKIYGQILNAVHSTNRGLRNKLAQLKYESFKKNLDDLHIKNTQ